MPKLNLRNFFIVSISSLIIVLFIIFYFINNVLRQEIQKTGELANATLTRIFVNETWSEIKPLLPSPGSTEDQIKNNVNIKNIDTRVRRFMSYTDVLKVKLYGVNGITLYSSDFKQIGENKANNVGFQQALKGQLASELTYRGQFGSFDGELYNRNLVSTYAPIRDGYQVVAVAEIYSDRTALIQQANEVRNQLFLILFVLSGIVYSLMLYFSYKIYIQIKRQPLEADENALENKFENFQAKENQLSNQSTLNKGSLTLPQLSLSGVERIMQYLLYSKYTNSLKDKVIDPKNLLAELSNQAELVIEKILRYNNLKALATSNSHIKNSNIAPSQLIQKLIKYSENNKALSHTKIQHNKNLPDKFIQNENLIYSLITAFLDLCAHSSENPDVMIKININEEFININLITNLVTKASPETHSLFEELDYLIHAISKRQLFNYKSTLSDKGLLVTLTFDQMAQIALTPKNEIPSEALIFGDSKLEMSFLSSILNRLGVSSISVVDPFEFNSFASSTTDQLVFILENTLENSTIAFNLIAHLKNIGFDPKHLIVITDSTYDAQLSSTNCVILPMPFDLNLLNSLVLKN